MEQFLLPSTLDGNGAVEESVVLDLGCGSGRDTVHMAQHLPPGTRVIGVDNHSYALDRGERLAEQWVDAADGAGTAGASLTDGSGLDGGSVRDGPGDRHGSLNRARARKCEWLLADLRKAGSLDGLKASVIHGHRFKCEQLLPLLRDDVSRTLSVFRICLTQRLGEHLVHERGTRRRVRGVYKSTGLNLLYLGHLAYGVAPLPIYSVSWNCYAAA